MNAGKTTSFDQAIAAANFHLVKEEDFILFIDVKRARFSGIRPLPQRVKTDSGWEIIKEETPKQRESLTPEDLYKQPETEPVAPPSFPSKNSGKGNSSTLRTYLSDTELQSALTKLYRSSRLSLEENGANTLYLALGFLKWYESPKSEQARYAPLLLLPVEIIRRSAQKGTLFWASFRSASSLCGTTSTTTPTDSVKIK